MKNTILITLGTFLLFGCSAIDDATNDLINGDSTTNSISAKERVIIINNVSLEGCAIIKKGLLKIEKYTETEILVTNVGVTCATYGKTKDSTNDINSECIEESLAEWLDNPKYQDITDFVSVEGDKSCVIGANL